MSITSAISGLTGLSNVASQDQVQGQASEADQSLAKQFNQMISQMTQQQLQEFNCGDVDDDGS